MVNRNAREYDSILEDIIDENFGNVSDQFEYIDFIVCKSDIYNGEPVLKREAESDVPLEYRNLIHKVKCKETGLIHYFRLVNKE